MNIFFFSSRRRHTRSTRDWSSDVCSSDLALEEDTKLEYRLEIHRPGSCDDQECLKIFTSAAPFLPLRIGDLLNASAWDRDASGWKLLRVVNVEHVISEKSGGGIDPSGGIIHRALSYTERSRITLKRGIGRKQAAS